MARTRLYRSGELKAEGFPVEDVSDHLVDQDAVVWVDFVAPTIADLALISAELGLHDVAIDDALGVLERPKVDRYDTHLLLTAYAVQLDAVSGALTASEVAVFVTRQALGKSVV